MTRRQQRLGLLALGMAALAGATALVLTAFNDNLVFFYGPSELKAKTVGVDRRVRIGGLVEAHSLSRAADGQGISFHITDGSAAVAVVYQGPLPHPRRVHAERRHPSFSEATAEPELPAAVRWQRS